MALPEVVKVKISSEAAGYVALTPVVQRELPLREMLENIAAVTGRDGVRIAGILKRGSLVVGGSRLRWEGFELEGEEVESALALLPADDAARGFDAARCVGVVLESATGRVKVLRELAEPKGFFTRTSFWSWLEEAAVGLSYGGYRYRERADAFRLELTAAQRAELVEVAGRLRSEPLAKQVRGGMWVRIEYLVSR